MSKRLGYMFCIGLFLAVSSGSLLSRNISVDLTQITATSGGGNQAYGFPSISADGERIVFQSNRDLTPKDPGNPDGDQDRFMQLFLWDAKQGFQQITSTVENYNLNALISADGSTVAFQSTADLTPNNPGHPEPNFEIYTWREDIGFKQITHFGNGYLCQVRGISADGTRLAILAGRLADPNNRNHIYIWSENEGLTQLTSGPATYFLDGMTADGRTLALISDADLTPDNPGNPNGVVQVFTWTEESGFRQITNSPSQSYLNERPAISPDGTRIVFRSTDDLTPGRPGNPNGNAEIFLWQEGAGFKQITASERPYGSDNPAVSDNGVISFMSTADLTPNQPGNPRHNNELFVWAESSGISQITATNNARNYARSITHDGTQIPLVSKEDFTGENPDRQIQIFLTTVAPKN